MDKTSSPVDSPSASEAPAPGRGLRALERLDDLAHILVAVVLVLLAASVLMYVGVTLARQFPLILAIVGGHNATATIGADPILAAAVDLFSNILFVVIVLEVLRTILAYLRSHSIVAIVKDFLVVGILTMVRRLLLLGAENALAGEKGTLFVQNSLGAMFSIIGILLLVGGLIAIQRGYGIPKDKF